MSIHISAEKNQIADKVILPGDPLRAKFIAETFLENVECYNKIRNMFGFTGTYKGKRVSVQGTGMGMPSIGIYAHELINDYGCKTLIRTGTIGAFSKDLHVGDVIIAQAAATESSMLKTRFGSEMVFPPVANFELLRNAVDTADRLKIKYTIGTVLSSDIFYFDSEKLYRTLMDYGVCGVEMECAELLTLGARFNVKTLGILTVSNKIFENEDSTSEQREKSFTNMMELALETI